MVWKKKKDEIELVREASKQAPKILSTIKDTSLTEFERKARLQLQLAEITPQLVEELKRLIELEAKSDQNFEKAMNGVLAVLTMCLNDKKIDKQERMHIQSKLTECAEIYRKYNESKRRETTKRMGIFGGLIALFGAATIIMIKGMTGRRQS